MKIAIIGAGVSGLSAGCYLQEKGFETEIFEKHARSGGLCTTWKTGEYRFDGCIHWLLGSNQGNAFYQLWSELIDMDSVEFVNHDVRVHIELQNNADKYGSKVFHLYNNLEKLQNYLSDIAPEDKSRIKKLIRDIKKIQQWEIPPRILTPPALYSFRDKIGMIRHLPLLLFMLRQRNITNFTFAAKLKNPFLREAFQMLFDGEEVSMLVFTFPLAFSDLKATGYPIGGSFRFAKRIEDRYLALGGKIHHNTGVREIIVSNGRAEGVILENGKQLQSDIVVSAADWHFTVFNALKGQFVNKKMLELADGKRFRVYFSVINVSLGISRLMTDLPHMIRFPLESELTSPDGTIFNRVELHVYNYDPTLSPDGKTCVSASFYTSKGEFWIDLQQNDHQTYEKVKKEFADKVIEILDKKFGRIKEFVEVTDVATPATFHRYTGNWQGSVQGWLPGKNIMAASPVGLELPGLKNFYYCSHWSVPGGGLPIAIKTARDLAQIIARRYR